MLHDLAFLKALGPKSTKTMTAKIVAHINEDGKIEYEVIGKESTCRVYWLLRETGANEYG